MSEKNNSDRRESTVKSDTKYKENFAKIFGARKPSGSCRMTFSHGDSTNSRAKNSTNIIRAMDEFISPIDQTIISDRRQLREHNKKHGVTNSQDYSAGFLQKKQKARTAMLQGEGRAAQEDRVQDLKRAIESNY